MGNLVVKSSSLSRTAEYTDSVSGIEMNLNYQLDEVQMTLKNISGSIYKLQEFVGSFTGTLQNGEIVYSLSEVKLADIPAVYDCLSDIDNQINGTNVEGGEA